jgi:hypothetical protein
MAAVRCGTSHGWIVASHPHVSKVITGRNARRTSLGLQIPINLHLSLDTTLRSRRADSLALRSGRYESLGHELELLYYSTILCPSSTIRPPFLAPSHMSHIKASKATGMQMGFCACLPSPKLLTQRSLRSRELACSLAPPACIFLRLAPLIR